MMLQLFTLALSMTSILAQPSSCGGTLYGSGYVRSPNYPLDYSNNLGCNWTLIASPFNGNILLELLAFRTQLCCDFVSIYDSNGKLVRRYSGTFSLTHYPIVLGSNAVVSFTTDNSGVSSGFSISFSTSVPCSNYTILNDSWRNVDSPLATYHCDNHLAPATWYRFMSPAGVAIPETTPPRKSCGTQAPMWLNGAHPRNASSDPVDRELCANWNNDPCWKSIPVKVALCPGGYYVYMTPASPDPECYDVQMAWCAANLNETLSPRYICEQQGSFYCSLSLLCVAYYHRCDGYSYCSYGEDEADCNNFTTATTSTTQSSSCGGTLYGSGYVQSPNYPSDYANNLSCNWTLIASPYNGNILLQLLTFRTESCCDFVSIYDSNGKLVHRYSGTFSLTDYPIVLRSNAVVSFTTDNSGVSSGFSISFSSSGPCFNYTVLNESWRNVDSPLATYHCDNHLAPATWYRFMSPAGIAIPETTPPRKSCGTQAPMWLNGAHPRKASSDPVDRELCANWNNDPCWRSIPVKVALCPGGYYVYMTSASPDPECYDVQMAWCAADLNETLSPRYICEQQGSFYCSLSLLCVAYYHRCDGYSYCSYGEDEADCNNFTTASTSTSTGRTVASERRQETTISGSDLPRGSWIFISGYVLAWLLGLPRLAPH